jgi:hypothetical protein
MSHEKMVPLEEAREQVRRITRRLAMMHLAYAKTIIQEMGEEKGRALVLKAIKNYAKSVGEQVKSKVAADGKPNAPDNYREDLPLYGINDSSEVVEVDGLKRSRVYGCVMAQIWHELGEDEIGRLYCYVDPAKYMFYNDKFKLAHVQAVPDGCEYCELAVVPATNSDRKALEADGDWRRIDTID